MIYILERLGSKRYEIPEEADLENHLLFVQGKLETGYEVTPTAFELELDPFPTDTVVLFTVEQSKPTIELTTEVTTEPITESTTEEGNNKSKRSRNVQDGSDSN